MARCKSTPASDNSSSANRTLFVVLSTGGGGGSSTDPSPSPSASPSPSPEASPAPSPTLSPGASPAAPTGSDGSQDANDGQAVPGVSPAPGANEESGGPSGNSGAQAESELSQAREAVEDAVANGAGASEAERLIGLGEDCLANGDYACAGEYAELAVQSLDAGNASGQSWQYAALAAATVLSLFLILWLWKRRGNQA